MPKRVYRWKRLPQKLRRAILERDSYECVVCGKKVGRGGRRAHVHHRRGHRVRNADSRRNLITLCASCHGLVGELAGNSKSLALDEALLKKAVKLALEHIQSMDVS